MKHVAIVHEGDRRDTRTQGCSECQTSCQSACKTSCTVGNQECEQQ